MILRTLFISYIFCIFLPPPANAAKDDWPLLLLTNRDNVLLIPSAKPQNTQVVASGMERACDFIYQDQLIFWIDEEKGRIQSINMSAPNRKKINVIDDGMARPEDIACDWIAKKIYWTDHNSDRIEVSELNGTSRKVLIWSGLEQPRAIAVDPFHAYMYWTDWGSDPKIERAGMDGSHRQVLINKKIYFPNGITLDYAEEKVYWTEAKYCFIHRMNMDGSNREEVITSSSININLNSPRIIKNNTPITGGKEQGDTDSPGALQHLFSITLYKDRVFWTDWETNAIYTILKNGSGVPELIKGEYIEVSHTMDVQAYSPLRQMPGSNSCAINNGGCSHLCLLSPDHPGYKCACPTGVRIKKDKKTCENGPGEILLIARRTDIRMISLDTEDHADVLVPVKNIKHAVAVNYDPVEGYVYWTDDDEKAILRAKLNGTGPTERIATNSVEQSDGLAVDWIARNLYWTDPKRDYIGVSRLNGTSRKILIETGVDEPRAIVVDPVAGYMYWTDWGVTAKIEKAYMDGTERQLLVSQHIVWPNGLAIDRERELLFWADAFVDKIEMIGLDGTGRTVLLGEKIPHVFGLSFLGDYIYWTDWQRRRVERMKIGDKSSRKVLAQEYADIMGVKATSTAPMPGTNPCAILNGGCSHLCLYTPQGRRCNCPTGLELAPNLLKCIVPEAFLLYSVPSGGIRGISLDTAQSDAKIPFESTVEANVMDFSVADSMIYWTNQDMTISRAYMNGSNVESFIDIGIELLEGLAVDWIGRNVYWADGTTNRIEVARMDSTSRRSILWEDMEHPRCIAMDPSQGYIYWSEWARVPCIKRAELDGSNPIQLTKSGAVGRVNSLTIDYADRRLYWVDFDINTIMSSNMNGTDLREIIVGKDNTTAIISLTLYGDYIYWSDNKGKTIQRANKTTGGNRKVIEQGIRDISMLVYHASRQSGVTACSHDNGGCQHLCLSMNEEQYKCDCPAHYTLNSDNVTCSAPENFILVSQTRYLSRIVYQSNDGQYGVLPARTTNYRGGGRKKTPIVVPDAVLPVRGLTDACAIDYDPIGGRVYWLDCGTGNIKSALQNGTQVITLIKGDKNVRIPFDIAVDPFSKVLYWTDLLTNSINVLRLNGEVIGTILSGPVIPGGTTAQTRVTIMPRKIVVDSERGHIYFTNACPDVKSCRFKIMQTTLDGSECEILFNRGLHNVTALAVDSKTNVLYWVDKTTIESSKLSGNGNDRTTLINSKLSETIGLAIFGKNIYWIDAQADNGLIEAANKLDGSNRRKIQGRIKNLRDIASIVKIDDKTIKQHPCYPDNGGCSHICVPKGDGTTRCSCPKSLTIVNESLCDEPVVCSDTEFTCKDKKCIPKRWRCDGTAECPDGSDELDCPRCKSNEYRCPSLYSSRASSTSSLGDESREFLQHIVDIARKCYPEEERCNGVEYCLGGEDEQGCHDCGPNEMLCGHKCVLTSVGCPKDCADGSDVNCNTHRGDNTVVIIIGIVCGCAILLGIGLFLKHCRTRSDRSQNYNSVVTYIEGSSNGPVNFNFRIHPNAPENSDPGLAGSGGSRKNNAPQPNPTTSFKFSIEQPGKGGSSRKNVPLVDAHMVPQGSQNSWYGYNPVITKGPDGKPVIMDRPCVTGESSGSSTKTLKQYLPTLNPPPSPATDRSGGKSVDCYYSSDSHSGYHTPCRCSRSGHKHRRSHHRQPHKVLPTPTPCTTDTCEDFDPHSRLHRHYKHGGSKSGSSSNGSVPPEPPPPYYRGSTCYRCCHHYSHHSSRCYSRHSRGSSIHQRRMDGSSSASSSSHHQCGGNLPSSDCSCEEYPSYPPSYSHGSGRHRSSKKKHSNYVSSDLNSDSDLFAPPPTPRSQYMSECCYTHGETTEAEENLEERDESSEVEEITSRIIEEKEEDEEGGTTDDAETVLLAPRPSSARMTEHSYCISNPPPSPADSS